jgi:predicted dehydrogenase
MKKIRAGIIGTGFIGISHLEAVRRIGFADLIAITDVNNELAKKKAEEYSVPKCYKSVDELLADSDIDIVHNCTPNNMHFEVNEKIIKAGKHIFSEKPLGLNSNETEKMVELLKQNSSIVHAINFLYRMNPLILDIKNRIKNGEIGKTFLVHGSFLQDWLLYETDYNWRVEPEICGPSRCIADLGSHWIDIAQSVTGLKIVEVCADLVTTIPVRKKPKSQVETFALNTNTEYDEKEIKTEDYGAVLIKFDNGAHGVFYTSEISAGRKCFLDIEIDGEKSSYYWNQETADHMWMGRRDEQNCQIIRNPNLMDKEARQYTYLAAGHPEGWNDAMRNNVYSVYKFISEKKKVEENNTDFANFFDGHYVMKIIDAILLSNKEKRWIKISK